MNLNVINTIVAVSKNKSFLEASYVLNYSPAVISKHVASAEEELGVRLFERGTKSSSLSLTPECEALLDDLNAISMHYDRILNLSGMLSSEKNEQRLRIGSAQKVWNSIDTDIISDFIMQNRDVTVENIHGYSSDMLRFLRSGKLDCVFCSMQGQAEDVDFMRSFMEENDCTFMLTEKICNMYLAISESDPLCRLGEAPFAVFRDHVIAFNSDKMALLCGNNMLPFLRLSQKNGFELKSTFLSTMDASSYRIAQKQKIAIPVPNTSFSYPGIKHVRITDWEDSISSYFVTMNKNNSVPLKRLRSFVLEYAARG